MFYGDEGVLINCMRRRMACNYRIRHFVYNLGSNHVGSQTHINHGSFRFDDPFLLSSTRSLAFFIVSYPTSRDILTLSDGR